MKLNRSTPPSLVNLTCKGATALVLALAGTTLSQAQSAGGGGGGGNSDWTVLEILNGWELSSKVTNQGQYVQKSPEGSTDVQTTGNVAAASIWGVPGSAKANATRKREFKVRWVGSGAPPSYAFIKLTSSALYWNNAGTGAKVELGLPMVQGSEGQQGEPSISMAGKKIAKVKVGTDGTAFFEVNNAVEVTAVAPPSLAHTAINGHLDSGAQLDLKALGLSYSSMKREPTMIGTHEGPGVPVPAAGDDFERQKAHIGCYFNADPLNLIGANGYVDININLIRILDWFNPAYLTYGGAATVSNPTTFLADSTGTLRFEHSLGFAELKQLWKEGPKVVTLWAKETDLGSELPGPYKGQLELSIHAPSELLDAINFTRKSEWKIWAVKQPEGSATAAGRLNRVGQEGVLTAELGQNTTTGFPVELSGGFDLGIWKEISVHVDIGKAVGEEQGFSASSGVELGIGPCEDPIEKWNMFERTTTSHRRRWQAKYGPNGFEYDYQDTIDNTAPAELEFETRRTASGLLD